MLCRKVHCRLSVCSLVTLKYCFNYEADTEQKEQHVCQHRNVRHMSYEHVEEQKGNRDKPALQFLEYGNNLVKFTARILNNINNPKE